MLCLKNKPLFHIRCLT